MLYSCKFVVMTLKEAHIYISGKLKAIYDSSEADNIAGWVVENLSGTKRTDRISNRERKLNEAELDRLEQNLRRLLNHEPVQYVLNEAWFCGLKLYVDDHVLIPRPETEELVEWIISDCRFPIDSLSILDIGSGSGCIPLALKKRLGKAEVLGCDVSEGALNVARKNSNLLGINVNFIKLDFLDPAEREGLPLFDILVSNPPYIPEKDKTTMHLNVLNYEPATALFVPDDDALVFYSAIAGFGKAHLRKDGKIYTEIHESLGSATRELFEKAGYNTEIKKDMQGKDRMVKAF